MAKITGLGGMLRGKSGPNVFRVSRGVQIMQAYNPNPNNPRSPKQTDRRLIFGDAVRQAKAFYDNPVTGEIWKKSQYKPRNLAVSEAMRNPVLSAIPGTELTRLAAANLNQNWTSGFDMFGKIMGDTKADGWSFTLSLDDLESNQPIIGMIIILYTRPGYKNSADDNLVYKLPNKPLVQAYPGWFINSVIPGESGSVIINESEFTFQYATTNQPPIFEMPESLDLDRFDRLSKEAVDRAWFAIPLTLENTGKGLRMQIDNKTVTLGSMQYIFSA